MNNIEIANLKLLAAQVDGHSDTEIAKLEYAVDVARRQLFVSKIKPVRRMVRLNEAYPDNVTSLPEMMTGEEEDAAFAREQFEDDQRLESRADAKALEDHYRKFLTPG